MIRKIISLSLPTSILGYIGASYISQQLQSIEKYKILDKNDIYEKRQYGDGLKAEIALQASSFNEALTRGIEQLNGYLYGGNSRLKDIPYLQPFYSYVYKGEDKYKNALVLIPDRIKPREGSDIYRIYCPLDDNHPKSFFGKSNNPYIEILNFEPRTVFTRRFWGYPTEKMINENLKILKDKLFEEGYEIESYKVAEYDKRWVFYYLRRNEIQASVYKKDE